MGDSQVRKSLQCRAAYIITNTIFFFFCLGGEGGGLGFRALVSWAPSPYSNC